MYKIKEVSIKNLVNLVVGQQYDHKKLAFKFVDVHHPELHQYLKIEVEWQENPLLLPLTDNLYIVGQPFTLHSGFFKAQLMIKDENGNYIANSHLFNLEVVPSIDPGEKYENVDPNLEIIYDEMKELINNVNHKLENGEFNGEDGKSAYEVAVKNGFKGSELEWLESLKGQKGDRGERGERGEKGETGETGQPGKDGTNGIDGVSPIVQVVEIENGHKVIITDKEGLTQFDVMNGAKGEKGDKGEPYEHSDEFAQLAEQVRSDAESAKSSEQNALNYSNAIKSSSDQIAQNKADIEELRNNPSVDLDLIEKLAIKDTAIGNPCVISDSADWKMKDLKVFGESTQATTTGAQLFNKETRIVGKIIDGNTGNELSNSRYACSDFIEIPQGTTNLYQTNGAINQRAFYDENKNFISKPNNNNNNNNNTQVVENAKYIRITSDIDKTDMLNIMLNIGTTAKPYEQYTGGKPSPSVDYSQEIINKEINQVKVTGKNLLDVDFMKDPNNWDNGKTSYHSLKLELQPNKKYVLSVSKNNMHNGYKEEYNGKYAFGVGAKKNDTLNWFLGNTSSSIVKNEIVVMPNENVLYINIYTQEQVLSKERLAIVFDELLPNIQLEISNAKTDYEPYKEQLVTLSQPITLFSTKDRKITDIVNSEVIERNIKEIKLDSSHEKIFANREENGLIEFSFEFNDIKRINTKSVICDKFPWILWNETKEGLYTPNNGIYIVLKLKKERLETLDVSGFRKWLSQNPLTMLYPLEIPTFEPLPQEDQDKIKALKMYYPNTVIHTGAQTEVTYIADPKLYIDKKLQPLNTVQSKILQLESEI